MTTGIDPQLDNVERFPRPERPEQTGPLDDALEAEVVDADVVAEVEEILANPIEPEPLHGIAATETLERERPHHRLAAMLLAQGRDPKEVAEALEVTPGTIARWLKVDWFQKRITTALERSGLGAIDSMMQMGAKAAVYNIIAIANDDEVPVRERLNANKDILDRFLGRSAPMSSPVQADDTSDMDPEEEYAALEDELSRLEENLPTKDSATDIPGATGTGG